MDLAKFKHNSKAATAGVEVDLGDGTIIKIARLGNPNYQECLRKLTKPHQIAIKNGTAPAELFEKISNEAIAETVLLGWTGLKEDGKEVPYSKEKVIEILTNPDYSDFRDVVMGLAQEIETFRTNQIEEVVGNSKKR